MAVYYIGSYDIVNMEEFQHYPPKFQHYFQNIKARCLRRMWKHLVWREK